HRRQVVGAFISTHPLGRHRRTRLYRDEGVGRILQAAHLRRGRLFPSASRHGETSELTFAAFYADCKHAIKPITQGSRVCLTYNLLQRSAVSICTNRSTIIAWT